jgi:hypothetical protein
MERINLTKEEKETLLSVKMQGYKQPRHLSPILFQFALSTLREKGLVEFKTTTKGDAYFAELTLKGKAYIEYNPMLKNPIPWKDIVLIVLSAITAVSTFIALFVGCSMIKSL